MLRDVVDVKATNDYRLWLRFDDGTEGEVDVASLVAFTGVFERLRDPAVFADVHVNSDIGTIVWPTGADIDPGVLYENLQATESR